MKKSVLLIWTLILVDLLSGLLLIVQFPFARIGLVIKGIVLILVFVSYLARLRQKSFKSIYTSLFILLSFWIVGFFTSLFNYSSFSYGESLVVLIRYFFLLIISCAFLDWSENDTFENECKKTFEIFFIINNAFIFIGFIFNIKMFSTYDPYGEFGEGWRFGYKGLIWGQNAVAAIYTLGIAYFFRENFKYHQPKMLALVITCIASILVGTKATWFTLILIGAYYLYKYRIKTLIILVVPALMGVAYCFVLYWSFLKDKYLSFMVNKYEESDLITFLTSSRDGLLSSALNHIYKDWMPLNFITGDAISYVEMDFFDLYFYFGLASFIYLYVYTKIFFIKDRSDDNKYFFLVWTAMAFFAGHIINSAIVPVFFLLFVFSSHTEKKRLTCTVKI